MSQVVEKALSQWWRIF